MSAGDLLPDGTYEPLTVRIACAPTFHPGRLTLSTGMWPRDPVTLARCELVRNSAGRPAPGATGYPDIYIADIASVDACERLLTSLEQSATSDEDIIVVAPPEILEAGERALAWYGQRVVLVPVGSSLSATRGGIGRALGTLIPRRVLSHLRRRLRERIDTIAGDLDESTRRRVLVEPSPRPVIPYKSAKWRHEWAVQGLLFPSDLSRASCLGVDESTLSRHRRKMPRVAQLALDALNPQDEGPLDIVILDDHGQSSRLRQLFQNACRGPGARMQSRCYSSKSERLHQAIGDDSDIDVLWSSLDQDASPECRGQVARLRSRTWPGLVLDREHPSAPSTISRLLARGELQRGRGERRLADEHLSAAFGQVVRIATKRRQIERLLAALAEVATELDASTPPDLGDPSVTLDKLLQSAVGHVFKQASEDPKLAARLLDMKLTSLKGKLSAAA